ncbi:MAG: DUF503 domain-containing protein [Chloroflexaceae bacterium]|nr:DUF503 domain-containing protein [Chloroflexaceae bacterium]NJL34098.1 DUF503 domain-containing protein [Chloroflexaceae bacterium]NJO06548.1 DUF503 domain-containing protein [Chloroflexaceae bacterium]
MFIGSCTITLHLPFAHSLKEKRQVVKSLLARIRNEFNVSAAEVDSQDVWQLAVIGVACVSASQRYTHEQLEAVVRFIEMQRPDVPLTSYEIEIL